jgi:hypothetical protein
MLLILQLARVLANYKGYKSNRWVDTTTSNGPKMRSLICPPRNASMCATKLLYLLGVHIE